MKNFAERMGYLPVKVNVQRETADIELRNAVWNYLVVNFLIGPKSSWNDESEFRKEFLPDVWTNVFKERYDELPSPSYVTAKIKDYIFKGEWYNLYMFLEYIVNYKKEEIHEYLRGRMVADINKILEENLSAYRLVDNVFIEVTSSEEIDSISNVVAISEPYLFVKAHLKHAIKLLSVKDPDYRNSIKESISAVEAVCQIITENKNATLGEALAILEKKGIIHGALKKSFSNLYGYTSDANGIRHALTENSNPIGQDEALFMLVSCSAFINFLIKKISFSLEK